MLTHVVDYVVDASGWGGCGRAHMWQHAQGRDAARCHAPASIVELLRADIWPPAFQLFSRRAANRDHGRADPPPAHAPLDFGKVLRSGTALTLQKRAAGSAAPNRDSSGLLIAAVPRRPGPRQPFVALPHGPT